MTISEALFFPCLLLGGHFTSAQDALQTAISGDRSEQARQLAATTDTGPERLKAGPFEFNVGHSCGLEYTDNVRNTSSPREEDFIQTPQINFNGVLPVSDTGRMTLGFGVGYADYFKHNELDRLYFSPNSELAYDFSVKDFRFTLYDSFNYSYDVQGVGAAAGVAQYPRFQNTAGIRAAWAPSKWSYQAGYSHFNLITDNSGSSGSDFSYQDNSSEQVFGRIAYSIAPATRVGMEVSSALTDYVNDAQPDNISVSVGPFTEWQVTEAFTVSLRGGLAHYSFDSTPGSTTTPPLRPAADAYELNSYYAGLGLNHRLTEYINHGVSASHSIQPGFNQGSDYTESTDAGYQVSWNLTQNTTLGANLSYTHGTESGSGLTATTSEDYDMFGFGVNGSYRISRQVTVTLTYNHNRRESNSDERSYFVNRVALGLRYQF